MSVTDRPTVPNDACQHKVATHLHGTRACYTLDGCRCDECQDARKRYDRHRARWTGEFPLTQSPYVDAEPVRRHLNRYIGHGMSTRRIAELTGVPNGAIGKLIYGIPKEGRPPSRQIRRENADRLLACPFDVADGARVDAREAKAIVAELVARGWAKAEIGRRLTGPQARSLQAVRTETVTAGNLRALRRLLALAVPQRVHGPTGKLYTPQTDHRWRHIEPNTHGVPPDPDAPAFLAQAKGKLRCGICDEPLATHPMRRCA
ncbi:MAG TPA: hypothetical protein VIG24_04890 [Acidimicrobiia bacterium]